MDRRAYGKTGGWMGGWTTEQMEERKEWKKRGVGRYIVRKTRY